ncbi:coiled-coil domain-containing protein 115 [Spea bombifrons]|uniref:coiled-coil domain-containing protein 115 n=1 Tax=Spea bombifrons TaxID=233779 RepID=UPI00234AFBDC|nr:coiled-coil domain-containing protein 115 [Spea bombifrons]
MAPAPEDTLPGVCQKLDHLILRLMEDLEFLSHKRDAMNQLIEKGWLLLSQSRYSMGNKFVSSLQYKQNMVASVAVLDRRTEDGGAEFGVERVEATERDAKNGRENREVQEIGPSESGLRHRKGLPETSRAARAEQEEDARGHGPPRPQDPLRWFGVLVPQSLRRAQSAFREGILLAADVASLQNSIESTRNQYHALLKHKRELQTQDV